MVAGLEGGSVRPETSELVIDALTSVVADSIIAMLFGAVIVWSASWFNTFLPYWGVTGFVYVYLAIPKRWSRQAGVK